MPNLAAVAHRITAVSDLAGPRDARSAAEASSPADRKSSSRVAQLVTRARLGDQSAWAELIKTFSPVVWTVARSFRLKHTDCEDVCQLTWSKVVSGVDSLRQPDQFGTWIVTTARHEALRYLMQPRRNTVPIEDEFFQWRPSDDDSPEDLAVARLQRDYVLKLFRELPEQHQLLMALLLSEPAPSYDEISRTLGIPRGSIGPTRQRILHRIRAALDAVTA